MYSIQTINKFRRLLHILMFLPAIIGIVMAIRRTLVLGSSFIIIGALFIGAVMLAGCSNSASEEELKKLAELKAQVASLENQVSAMQRDKTGLEKQIAETLSLHRGLRPSKLEACQ